jgi:hypothetical protein
MYDKRMLMKLLGKVHTIELEDLYSITRNIKNAEMRGKTNNICAANSGLTFTSDFPEPLYNM